MISTVNSTDTTIKDSSLALGYLFSQIVLLTWILFVNMFLWIVLRVTERFHQPLDYFMACLIILNYIMAASSMPLSLVNDIVLWKWTFGSVFCEIWHGFEFTSRSLQAWFICVIVIDRLVCYLTKDKHYEHSHKRARLLIALVFVIGMIACLIIFLTKGGPNLHSNGPIAEIKTCYLKNTNTSYTIATSVFSFFIPAITAIVTWIILLIKVRKTVFGEVHPLTKENSMLSSKSLVELSVISPRQNDSPVPLNWEMSFSSKASLISPRCRSRQSPQAIAPEIDVHPQRANGLSFNEDIIKRLPPATAGRFTLPKLDHVPVKLPPPTEVRFRAGSTCSGTSGSDIEEDGPITELSELKDGSTTGNAMKPNNQTPFTVGLFSQDLFRNMPPSRDSGIDSPMDESQQLDEIERTTKCTNAKIHPQPEEKYITDTMSKKQENNNMPETKDAGTLIITDELLDMPLADTPLPNAPEDPEYLPDTDRQGPYKTEESNITTLNMDTDEENISQVTVEDYDLLKKLGIIICLYFAFWLPFNITYIALTICPSCDMYYLSYSLLNWLGYANAAVNPFTYYMLLADFRTSAKDILQRQNPNDTDWDDYPSSEVGDNTSDNHNTDVNEVEGGRKYRAPRVGAHNSHFFSGQNITSENMCADMHGNGLSDHNPGEKYQADSLGNHLGLHNANIDESTV